MTKELYEKIVRKYCDANRGNYDVCLFKYRFNEFQSLCVMELDATISVEKLSFTMSDIYKKSDKSLKEIMRTAGYKPSKLV